MHNLLHFMCAVRTVLLMESPAYRVSMPLSLDDPDAWFTVSGDGMAHELQVKIRLFGPGRPAVYALRIDDDAPISSRQLRDLRLPEIANAVLHAARDLAREVEENPHENAEFARAVADWEAYAQGHAVPAAESKTLADLTLRLHTWLDGVANADSALPTERRGRGASSPTEDDYRSFARTYLEELLAEPTSAAARTAARRNMSRATTYRWIAACRDRDLLPPREDLS